MTGVRRRLAAGAVLTVAALLAAGCSEARDAVDGATSAAQKVRDCAGLAADAARAGIGERQVSVEDAQQAAQRVEQRVSEIDNADVRAAAERLQAALADAAEAVRTQDTSRLEEARQQVTDAARRAAESCDLPVEQFTR
jgi:hypothetical protein